MKRATSLAVLGTAVLAAGAAAGPATAAHSAQAGASGLDKEYLKTSIEGDRFEIQGGRLAEQRSTSKVVRALGARLVKDHSKSLSDAEQLARQIGVDIPKTPSPSEQWELGILRERTGHAFDRGYTSLEVKDHMQDISEASDEASDGSMAAVVSDAKTELPMLRKHLRLSRAALKTTR
jgi:putative membrane protein